MTGRLPDPDPVVIKPAPAGWPAPTARFTAQRWLVDLAVRTVGVDWDQGRTRYLGAACGTEGEADFARAREQIGKLADMPRVFSAAARSRESRAAEAAQAGHARTAARHSFVASILWGAAEWPFFVSEDTATAASAANDAKVAAYHRYAAGADHPVEVLSLSFGDARLSAYLHLPPGAGGRVPCVLHYGGMDSFKEHGVQLDGDRFLERGMARLTFDGPGQGESIHRGVFVSASNMVTAGLRGLDFLRDHPAIDAARLGISGVSFGSFWATQLAAYAPDVAGTAVWALAHEPGCRSIFETTSPTFKARFMAMAGIVDEGEFDNLAAAHDLRPLASHIEHPYLALAGEDDELSPVRATRALLSEMRSTRELVVYRGERHSVGGGPAAKFGPHPLTLAADWFADRFAGRDGVDRITTVQMDGLTSTEPVTSWL
jgi:dipeptidyl aminopeptidase/acylaminoacyl peptidase